MSSAAIAIIALVLMTHGTAPQADEGGAAHLWQLLMAAQLPVIAWFAIRWLPHAGRRAMLVLALQVGAAAAALAPVLLLHW